ncbi:MAG: hypothetical protein WC855_02450 [Thermodesulfovibrionales bacterium]
MSIERPMIRYAAVINPDLSRYIPIIVVNKPAIMEIAKFVLLLSIFNYCANI